MSADSAPGKNRPDARQEARWWLLYRKERAKFGTPRDRIKDSEIVRAAREATRRFNEEANA